MARGKTNDKIDIEARRAKAIELRKSGASYRAIAKKLNVDVSTAYSDVVESLRSIIRLNGVDAQELQAIELERLDAMLLSISTQLKAGHLGAIDRALKIMERRAKLLGLDEPEKHENITWETRAIEDIKAGKVTYEMILTVYDGNATLAEQLFRKAGVPIER